MPDDSDTRAAQRDLVRRGYDTVSRVYRTELGESSAGSAETTSTYVPWIEELSSRLTPSARVLDIGCGAGVPADRLLVEAGFEVTGIDISQIQIDRARKLVTHATFVCGDIVDFVLEPESFDAIISLYALIHIPLEDQRDLLPRSLSGASRRRPVPRDRRPRTVDWRRGLPGRANVLGPRRRGHLPHLAPQRRLRTALAPIHP